MDRRLALVTGASAGIGAAFARLYAARGYDVALTARRRDRLESLAQALQDRHGVRAFALPADLADPAAPAALLEALAQRGRSVDVLVNNAGYGLPGAYGEIPWDRHAAFIQVMVAAPSELARRVLDEMSHRRYGRIVNVASLAGLLPGAPGSTLYAASKAFLIRFSQSLQIETRGSGVHVSALCPGFTWSEFHDVTGSRALVDRSTPRWLWQDAGAVAQAGYAAVEANRAVCVPGAPNRLIATLARLAPEAWGHELAAWQGARFRDL